MPPLHIASLGHAPIISSAQEYGPTKDTRKMQHIQQGNPKAGNTAKQAGEKEHSLQLPQGFVLLSQDI